MTQDNMPDRIYATGGPTSGSWNKEPIGPRVAPPQTTYLAVTPAREAAEDMLQALEQVLIEYDHVELKHGEPSSLTAAILHARAAIAKARGEQ